MSHAILYAANATNFFNLGLGVLTDAKPPKVTQVGNSEFILEMDYPVDGKLFDQLKNGNLIKADAGPELKAQRFEIKRLQKSMRKNHVTVYAEHISYQTLDISMPPKVTLTGTAQNAMRQAQSLGLGSFKPFTMTSDIATSNSTTFTIRDIENLRQALSGVEGSILDTWGGEFLFDNYHISLFKQRGRQANAMIAYGRNLIDLEQEESILNTFTSVFPYAVWRTEDGAEEFISGNVVHSEHVDKYPHEKVLPVEFTLDFDEEKPTAAELDALAQTYIENNDIGVPSVSIQLSHIDLAQSLEFPEYAEAETINLFDRVKIHFEKLGIDTVAKVVRSVWNVNLERYDEIEVGHVRASMADRFNAISKEAKAAKREAEDARNIAVVSANGINMTFYGPNEPVATKIGDTWFQEDGQFTITRVWNGVIWKVVSDPRLANQNAEAISQQQEDLEAVKQSADESAQSISDAIAGTDFLDLDDMLTSMRSISEQTRIDAESAMSQAITNAGLIGDMETSISNIDLDIDEINGTMSLKADVTEIDRIDGTIDSIQAEVSLIDGELSSKITQTQLQGAIDGIEIGGRNLLKGTSDFNSSYWFNTQSVTTSTLDSQYKMVRIGIYPDTPRTYMSDQGWNFIIGETYTISVYARSDEANKEIGLTAQSVNWNPQKVTSEWKRYIWTFEAYNGSLSQFRFEGDSSIWITLPKIEVGTKALGWQPAPEDNIELISSIQTEWTQTFDTFKTTVSDLEGNVSSHEQTINTMTQSISDAEGNIASQQLTIDGLVSTVADKANQSDITQLSSLIDLRVTSEQAERIALDEIKADKTIADRRSSNEIPQWYFTNFPRQTVKEFKNDGAIGLSAVGTYGVLVTEVPWTHKSGGRVKQIFYGDTETFQRYGNSAATAWEAWDQIAGHRFVTSQFSILDDKILGKVSEGDVYSQLLIDSRNILFDAYDRIMLSADKVVIDATQTFIPGAVIKDASIDSAKISEIDANQVDVINLNANNIVSGEMSANRIGAGVLYGENMHMDLTNGIFQSTSQIAGQLAGILTITAGRLESISNIGTGNYLTLSGDQLHIGDNDGYVQLTPRYIDFETNGSNARMRFNGDNLVLDTNLGLFGSHINSVDWIRLIGDNSYEMAIHKHPTANGGAIVDSAMVTLGLGIRNSFSSIAQFYGQIDFRRNLHMLGNDLREVNRVALHNSNTHFLSHPSSSTAGGAIVDSTRFTVGIGSITSGFNDRIVVTNSEVDILAHLDMNSLRIDQVARLQLSETSGYFMHLSSGAAVVDSRMVTIATGSPSSVSRVADFYGQIHFYKNLYMNGNSVIEGSDERIKENITNRDSDDLATIKAIDYKNYDMIDGNKNQRGFIAQQLMKIDSDLIIDNDGQLGYNTSGYMHTIGHGLQQLAYSFDDFVLEVEMSALEQTMKDEEQDRKIEALKEENARLWEELNQLKGAA